MEGILTNEPPQQVWVENWELANHIVRIRDSASSWIIVNGKPLLTIASLTKERPKSVSAS